MELAKHIFVLQLDSEFPIIRYLILEMSWIVSNFTYSDEETIKILFYPQYGLIEFLNKVLASRDNQLIDQVIWIISNTAVESIPLRNMIL